jgi:hypothetical protein
LLALFFAWLSAHPYETVFVLYVALGAVNAALPARVRTGPVGAALHTLLDRLSPLTRSDAPGTLKWPGVASAIVGRPLASDVVDVSGPAIDDVHDRPTRYPPGVGPGLGVLLVVWGLLSLAGCASGSAGSAAAATGEALAVVREVRERACDPLLDAVLGPIRSRPCECHCPLAGSGGAAAPPVDDAGTTTPAPSADAATQAPDAGDGQ